MYKEVWQRAVSVSYCFAPAAAILLFVACYNSRPLVGCHDIHYEDLWCQRAECIAERRRRARGQNERDGAGRWPVVELRHYTVQHTSSSTWAHGGALIHRWNAERSSLTRSQPRACVSARVWQLRVERRWGRGERSWDFKESEGFKVYIIKEDLRSLRYNPTSEEGMWIQITYVN